MSKLIIGFLLFFIAQSLILIQLNGQFVWPWFKKNPWIVSFSLGGFISYILIMATRSVVEHFNGLLWPGRFIGFSSGIIVFAIFTYIFLNQGITPKTLVSLVLAFSLICVQLFWK